MPKQKKKYVVMLCEVDKVQEVAEIVANELSIHDNCCGKGFDFQVFELEGPFLADLFKLIRRDE